MPLENLPKMDEKKVWNFTNILAYTVVVLGLGFIMITPFVLSKLEIRDNTMLSQTNTGILSIITMVLAYYFVSSVNAGRQQQQIADMQKTATSLALKNADVAMANATGTKVVDVENKVDKAVAIEKLKAKLIGMEPDSEDALALVAEIEQLEKES